MCLCLHRSLALIQENAKLSVKINLFQESIIWPVMMLLSLPCKHAPPYNISSDVLIIRIVSAHCRIPTDSTK